MRNFLENRGLRLKSSAALIVGAALAVTGFVGVKAATPRLENPPATIKTAARSPETARRGYSSIVKKVVPAVVNISSSRVVKNEMTGMQGFQMDPLFRQFFGNNMPFNNVPKERREKALGSGVIVSPEGYILTNNHVIDKATEITVTLHDKREFKARVVGTDPRADIAVLKINGNGDFPYLTLGDSSQVEVGDIVLAIGDPFGIGQTVTSGIVSATNRSMNQQIEGMEDFIQTDAAINPGNSGGALVDDEGHLIGINTAILSGNSGGNQGIGFAVPVNLARHDMDQILKYGKVETGYLGILPQDVTPEMAKALGVSEATGSLVGDVTPNSPASRAGLQKGDIILAINGQPVEDANSLRLKVGMLTPGTNISLKVLRDNRTMEMNAQLGNVPSAEEQASSAAPGEHETMLDGVQLSTLTPDVAQQLQLGPNVKGVVVESVADGSAAADAGLQRGDVIQQVNHHAVTNMNEFRQAMSSTTKNNPVLLLVNRQGTTLFIAI